MIFIKKFKKNILMKSFSCRSNCWITLSIFFLWVLLESSNLILLLSLFCYKNLSTQQTRKPFKNLQSYLTPPSPFPNLPPTYLTPALPTPPKKKKKPFLTHTCPLPIPYPSLTCPLLLDYRARPYRNSSCFIYTCTECLF